jgi:hypothetical protein
MVSCKEDDPAPVEPTVEDGTYIMGAGTALTTYDLKGLMKATKNEVDQTLRSSLLELFIPVKAGADGFNIVVVNGTTKTTYGPGADFAEVTVFQTDEPSGKFSRGTLTVTDTKFTVAEDGLYHIVYDTELGIVVVAKAEWGVIGGATPGGWSSNTAMTAAFDLNKMDFIVTELTLLQNDWKFRYSNGWKIFLDEAGTVKVNTNLGGTVDALEPGGGNIANAEYAVFTVTLTYELGVGFSATQVRTGDAIPLPTYPEAMFLVGDATAYGWDAPGTTAEALLHKCAGGAPSEGIYWKIAHLEAGLGFKLAAENWTEPNLGFGQVGEFDADGIVVTDNGGNMSVATSGMYIIVLNLRDDAIKVSIKEAAVYGIGDAFGAWDEEVAAYKFTIDNANKTLVSPAVAADANIRIYAEHAWIPAWWNAEFNVFAGKIEYRNDGGDQAAVAGTTGQVIKLLFDNNTGSIE